MTVDREYPVSLLLEGPLFRDELETQPQHFVRTHDIDSLRLVPSKSAADGVYTIYFSPEHRQWALVRLANRYRGLFEIQLQRGMSGEHQLLRQGFTSADVDFLLDIVPRPPRACSPVVYDMLWLVATYEEYLVLAESILERETFVPRDVLRSADGVDVDDQGFFTRFLRSHFIRPRKSTDDDDRRRDDRRTEIDVDLDAEYEVTDDGAEALADLIAEYERIFERKEFEPLLTNPELDPLRHLRAYESDSGEDGSSLERANADEGALGEIAETFAPSANGDPERDRSPDPDESTDGSPTGGDATETVRKVGEFTEAEVVEAAVAAARLIDEEALVRTSAVKTTVWEAVDLGERDQGSLWTAVRDVLLAMDGIHGRENGHVWTSTRSE